MVCRYRDRSGPSASAVARKELNRACRSNQAVTIMMMRETGRQRSLLAGNDLSSPDLEELQSTISRPRAGDRLGSRAMRANASGGAALAGRGRVAAIRATRKVREGAGVVHFVRTDKPSERFSEASRPSRPNVLAAVDPVEMDERLSHFYGSDNFEALDYAGADACDRNRV
jgi:hypothetical protein